jgi:hypothetical protein
MGDDNSHARSEIGYKVTYDAGRLVEPSDHIINDGTR